MKTDVLSAIIGASTLKTLRWDNPNSRAVSHEFLHNRRYTAAVLASSMFGVRTVRGRPVFTSTVFVESFSNCSNTFFSG